MKLFEGRNKMHFEEAALTESVAYLGNPGCGWYHIHTFLLQQEPDMEELKWCVCREETLALLLFDIGAYRSEPLPDVALQRMERVLAFFRKEGRQVIVRIVYDREGKGMEQEPDTLSLIETHMKQTGAVLRAYEETLLLVQGLFVGNWGEMHGSKYLSRKHLKQLWTTFRAALGEHICMAVRTPVQWRELFGEGTSIALVKTGVFDDGMFGSKSNLGTYGISPEKEAEWTEKWCREDEAAFLSELSKVVPYGGEAVGEKGDFTPEDVIRELKQTGACYLNSVYDERRLNEWKQAGIYDTIGTHLGYRFVVRSCKLAAHAKKLVVTVENTGFSTLKEAVVLQIYTDGQEVMQEIQTNPMEWKPGQRVQFSVPLTIGSEKSRYLYLQCKRKRDGKIIRFANEPVSEAVCLGLLTNT